MNVLEILIWNDLFNLCEIKEKLFFVYMFRIYESKYDKKLFVGDKILLLIIKFKLVEYVSDINCVEWWLKNNI